MDPLQEIPKRTNFWFDKVAKASFHGKLLDKVTLTFSLFLTFFVIIVFWPLISQIKFEEAFYTPLVPYLIWFFSKLNLDANGSLQLLFILSLVATGLGIYLLVRDLTKRQVPAILASIIYIIPPVPIFILTFFRKGFYTQELVSAKSFFSIIYGDGALFLALALVPYGAIVLLRYLKSGNFIDLFLCVVISGLILLANGSQALGYFVILFLFFLTDIFLGNARLKLKRFSNVIFFSLGIVSFWYTPFFWLITLRMVLTQILENIKFLFPLPFIAGLISLLFAYAFFGRRVERQAIFASFLTFIAFFALIWSWLFTGHTIVFHPHHFLPNLVMFGAIVAALSLSAVFDRLDILRKLSFEKWSSIKRAVGALTFGVLSFILLSSTAYIFSSAAILAVSGPVGIWTKIRMNVLLDRHETFVLAGGNFKLISNSADDWQRLIGFIISLIFLVSLFFLLKQNLPRFPRKRVGGDN